jgi:hypothetical protein
MDVLAYGKKLLARGHALIKEGKYEDVAHEVFSESNHGHSGWVLGIRILYEYPQNEEELLLRNAFIQLLNETLSGIKDVSYPSASAVDRSWLLEAACTCLEILGKSALNEFILWQNTECVALKMETFSFRKKIHSPEPREYRAIRYGGHNHLTITEHLNALEVELLGELIKCGCKERIHFPFAPQQHREIDMRECPAAIRPRMREYWELLQAVRRVKKFKLG